jgi:hypothetical protein
MCWTFLLRRVAPRVLRELIIRFGGSGYVALFEVVKGVEVVVCAVRHQLEEDYH